MLMCRVILHLWLSSLATLHWDYYHNFKEIFLCENYAPVHCTFFCVFVLLSNLYLRGKIETKNYKGKIHDHVQDTKNHHNMNYLFVFHPCAKH